MGERCGVAESTVSDVSNGTKFVSPKIREKVLQVVGELNFHRASHAAYQKAVKT
jgi:DNA-binding LacI/PurR family transcriptional regulator